MSGAIAGVSLKREVGIGEIVVVVTALVGMVLYFGKGDSKAEAMAVQLANLSSSIARVEGGVAGLTTEVRLLPSLNARLDVSDREIVDLKARAASLDQALANMRDRVIRMDADLEGVKRASNVRLPGSPR
jgi:hypothetical protein